MTARVLGELFKKLAERRVGLRSCIIKCSMVQSGDRAEEAATHDAIGMATAAILRHAVPRYVAGVLLLSGGMEPKVATKNLTAIMHNSPFPCVFESFRRASACDVERAGREYKSSAGSTGAAFTGEC